MSKIPDRKVPLTIDGILTEPSRLFLSSLQGIIDSTIAFIYRTHDFDDLAAIKLVIKNPSNNMHVTVNNQGLARFKESSGVWVLASNDTTPIT